jgi:hypothetical protein
MLNQFLNSSTQLTLRDILAFKRTQLGEQKEHIKDLFVMIQNFTHLVWTFEKDFQPFQLQLFNKDFIENLIRLISISFDCCSNYNLAEFY